MVRLGLSGLAAAVALVVIAPTPAHAVDDTYREIDERRFSPAPLVPTRVPPSLRPIQRSMGNARVSTPRGYTIRLRREYFSGDAVIAFSRNAYRSMRAYLREQRRAGFRRGRIRIRGRRGYLMTRRVGNDVRELAWIEGGALYTMGTGSTRRVTLSQLRWTAAGVEPLVGAYFTEDAGTGESPEAQAVLTRRTVSGRFGWRSQCAPEGASQTYVVEGSAEVTLLRRRADAFSFDIASNLGEDDETRWEGTVDGRTSPAGIAVTVRATGAYGGDPCATGAQSYDLTRVPGR